MKSVEAFGMNFSKHLSEVLLRFFVTFVSNLYLGHFAFANVAAVNTPIVEGLVQSNVNALKDVDFRRGDKGDGVVLIGLPDTKTTVDVSRVGSNILLNIYRTDLPDALNRKLDVSDFATPIKSIDTQAEGSAVKITIAVAGEYDYLTDQVESQYVVRVKRPSKKDWAQSRSQFEYTGEKLSLNFQDIELRSVLQIIADFTDLNLVASDTVRGNVTLRLQDVPWDHALDIILKSKGLDKRREGNVLLVAPAVEIAERERLQVEANKQLVALAPLLTDFVRIHYADARTLFDLFNIHNGGGESGNSTSSLLSARGSAIVDERTNTIILTDVQDKVDEFRRLVKEIDVPIRQVEIEARIIIASTNFKKEIGVRWGVAGSHTSKGDVFEFGGRREILDSDPGSPAEFFGHYPVAAGNATAIGLKESLAVDLGVKDSFGSFAMGLITDNILLDLELSALENDGYGDITSQPKVVTGDKQTAIIKAGQEIPYQSGTSSGETEIEFREAVLKLEVTPQITPDKRVIMDLIINQDTIGDIVPTAQGGSEPTIDVTEIKTQVLVGDGQTLVLGGIFQVDEVKRVLKVPVLGDIPYLGRLFRKNFSEMNKREILIFVTPRIISDPLLDQ